MIVVKVLAPDLERCADTVALIEEVARAVGADCTVDVVLDVGDMMAYGVMETPGVVIDGVVMHMGGTPPRERVARWFV
jgi:Thioredoxin domain